MSRASAIVYAHAMAPLALLLAAGVLFLYRKIYTEVVEALPLDGGAYNCLLKEAIEQAASARGRLRLYDTKGQPLLLFENEWALRWAMENERKLSFHDVAP